MNDNPVQCPRQGKMYVHKFLRLNTNAISLLSSVISILILLSLPPSSMCDDRSVHLHCSENELSRAQSSERHLWLLLHPGLDQLPHDSHQRPHVPGAQEAQIEVMGLTHRLYSNV